MAKPPPPQHAWDLTPSEAIALQYSLRAQLAEQPEVSLEPARYIAGGDVAFDLAAGQCVAAIVVWDRRTACTLETRVVRVALTFPYIPGLLSFREVPALLAALAQVSHPIDALICDGHGVAHPRGFGLACHLGLLSGLPTIGCAKSRLFGTHRVPGMTKGSTSELRNGEALIGYVLRSRRDVRPVYVSVGYRVGLTEAVKLVDDCCRRYRLPEPTHQADRAVARAKLARQGLL